MRPSRLVVTGIGPNGEDLLNHDGPALVVHHPAALAGVEIEDLWVSDTNPPRLDGPVSRGVEGPDFIEPIPGGVFFRVIEYQPGVLVQRHRTNTIDFVTILEGEVVLGLDEKELTLGPRDQVVQRGVWHSWENRGTEPCVCQVVEVGAAPGSLIS
jgi:quercetin dioxygenase-like cupin family protein